MTVAFSMQFQVTEISKRHII